MQQHRSYSGSKARSRPVFQRISTPDSSKKVCCHNASECTGEPPQVAAQADQCFNWQISGMDCPACARKIESAVHQLAGISSAQVLFATQKLVVTARADVRVDVEQAVKDAGFMLHTRVSPPQHAKGLWRENRMLILLTMLLATSWFLVQISTSVGRIAFIFTTLVGLLPIARNALRLLKNGTPFSVEMLMSVAATGALFIGATAEAAMVLLLFMLGERLEAFAAARARQGVTALMALQPRQAVRIDDHTREIITPDALRPGDIIEVSPGSRLPADATLLSPFASFDESALTGESIPVERHAGEQITAGSLSIDRLVRLEVVSQPGESAIDRILHLIEEAESHRAPVERFLDRFSGVYTPAIIVLSLLVAVTPPLLFDYAWYPWIYKGLTLLLIGCPCALVISTPAAITSALAAATRRGALIKGGAALESLSTIRTIAFDKTGTLTIGQPQVITIVPLADISESDILAKAAAIETGSTHPLARAIVADAMARSSVVPSANDLRTLSGIGIEGYVSGCKLSLYAPARVAADTLSAIAKAQIARLESSGLTVVVLLKADQPVGLIGLRDKLREDARAAVDALQAMNISCVMLTGDNARAASAIADELDIRWQAGLRPDEKVAAISKLNGQHPVAMVGDGINDAPAMKAATVGIAMGSGSDVALDVADAALTHNRLTELVMMIHLARATHHNIRQNVAIALGLKAIFLLTTLYGITNLWLAVLADSGATALVTANSLRLLRKKKH